MSEKHDHVDWKTHGVKVIPGDQLDPNTAQTPGMDRAAAINFARVGAQKIWAGTVKIHPNAKTGAHNHSALESVIPVRNLAEMVVPPLARRGSRMIVAPVWAERSARTSVRRAFS